LSRLCKFAVEFQKSVQMKHTYFRERKVFYSVEGKGTPVVLLHGFCEDQSIWQDFLADLTDSECRVVTIDLPGFGNSEPLAAPEIADYALAVHAVVTELGLPPFVLIGHSMGGYTALAFAEKFPEMLIGIGLFHSHPYADSTEKIEARHRQIEFIEKQGHELFVKQLVPVLFAPSFARSQTFLVNRLILAASMFPKAGIIGGLKAMIQRPDRSETLKKAPWPVMFIIGEADKVIPEADSLSQTTLPPIASVHFLEKTGHMGMFEAPAKTKKIVRDFIAFCQTKANLQLK